MDNRLVKLQQNETKESESNESNSTFTKSTNKVMKNLMNCLNALIQHTENAFYRSNDSLIVNKRVQEADTSDIEIVEHSIKYESAEELNVFRYLKSIKKIVLRIALLCVEKNIAIKCDLSFNRIDYYKCLDESTRHLVIAYLTENAVYLIEHIGFVINMFNQEENIEEAKLIKKSLQKIYKQIILIPLNENLDETCGNFKEQDENDIVVQCFTEKLSELRTAIIKLKKIYKKKLLDSSTISLVDDDSILSKNNTTTPNKRKRSNISEEINDNEDSLFLNPNDSKNNKKRKKRNTDSEVSDLENTKKKSRTNNSDIELISFEIDLVSNEGKEKNPKKKKKISHNTDEKQNKDISRDKNKKQSEMKVVKNCDKFEKKNKVKKKQLKALKQTSLLDFSVNKTKEKTEQNNKVDKTLNEEDIQEPDQSINCNSNDKQNLKIDDVNKYLEIVSQENTDDKHALDCVDIDTEDFFSNSVFEALGLEKIDNDKQKEASGILKENSLNKNEKFLYLQDLIESTQADETIPEDMEEKLTNLRILIDFEIPASHEVGTRLCHGASPEEQAELHALGVHNRKYTLEEDDSIRRNWSQFCKSHDLNPVPEPFMKLRESFLKYNERKKFLQYLGKELPHRSLTSIYKRFKTLFRPPTKLGRFTADEDELIITYCKTINSKYPFVALAKILHRHRAAIERRHRVLTKSHTRLCWTLEMEENLVKQLLSLIDEQSVDKLQHIHFDTNHYKRVGQEMDIPWEKIRMHWLIFLFTKLFSKRPLDAHEIKMELVDRLIALNANDWRVVDWDDIASHFEGISKQSLWSYIRNIINAVEPKKRKDMSVCLKLMKEHLNKRTKLRNVMPRYKWTESGNLEPYL